MIRLLLVEDDANLCYIIRGGLEDMIGGYEVLVASDGAEGLEIWRKERPDVIVSDIEMPGVDGYEMVRRIRETDASIPILFTSGHVSPKDVVKGYGLGANNYIKKPFLAEELDAHVKALLKLLGNVGTETSSDVFHIGSRLVFDAGQCTLETEGGGKRTLTAREAGVLRVLCENKGKLVRREAILSQFWNKEDDYFASRSLDVFVSRLRKLLAADASVCLNTVKGVGLVLEDQTYHDAYIK